MTEIKSILHTYLDENKMLKLVPLGSDMESQEISKKANDILTDNIIRQTKFNNIILIVSIVLLCLIFSLGFFFAIYYRDDPAKIGIIFGGTFLSLLAIVSRLRKIWIEKSIMDVSLTVIDGLPAPEAAKFIQTIYFNMINKKK